MFPAQAGMNRYRFEAGLIDSDVPRSGGDEPIFQFFTGIGTLMFPAQAGMNRGYITLAVSRDNVPRSGGDEPQ